jgi:hypothetical protein
MPSTVTQTGVVVTGVGDGVGWGVGRGLGDGGGVVEWCGAGVVRLGAGEVRFRAGDDCRGRGSVDGVGCPP